MLEPDLTSRFWRKIKCLVKKRTLAKPQNSEAKIPILPPEYY